MDAPCTLLQEDRTRTDTAVFAMDVQPSAPSCNLRTTPASCAVVERTGCRSAPYTRAMGSCGWWYRKKRFCHRLANRPDTAPQGSRHASKTAVASRWHRPPIYCHFRSRNEGDGTFDVKILIIDSCVNNKGEFQVGLRGSKSSRNTAIYCHFFSSTKCRCFIRFPRPGDARPGGRGTDPETTLPRNQPAVMRCQ